MILGLDPGRDKTGWALVSREGTLFLSGIFPTPELEAFLEILERPSGEWEKNLAPWFRERQISITEPVELEYVALGDGTGSREILSRIGSFDSLGGRTRLINERGTTLAARELYWSLHAPAWWQRLLPRSLRVPPGNLDDLAAWQIVLRSLAAAL